MINKSIRQRSYNTSTKLDRILIRFKTMHSKQLGHNFLSPKAKRNGTKNRKEDKENENTLTKKGKRDKIKSENDNTEKRR